MFNDTEAPLLFDPAKDTAAVFIDFENMRLTVEESGEEPFQIGRVLEYVDQNIGRVTIKKAYSNWHYVNPHMYNLLGNNVDLIQVYTRGTQRKNAADIRLTADAMETLFLFAPVTTFVIVASDSDYTGLIINLRKHGKKVVGIGTRQHTSDHLVRACNLFRFYRTIATDDPHVLREQVGDIDIQEAKDLLVRAMQRHRFDDRPALGRWLRWQMIQIAPSFDEADLGFTTFREFLEACSDTIHLSFDERFQEMKVELVGGRAAHPRRDGGTRRPISAAPRRADGAYVEFDDGDASDVLTITDRETQTFPTRPEDVRRNDYLRTLWAPRIYLYNRDVAAPIIGEIYKINGPGKPMSEYELEEHLLGPYAEEFLARAGLAHYELTQKTIYALQKQLFWAGAIRFLDDDEYNYWKKRKREIVSAYDSEQDLLEGLDVHLTRHYAKYLPLVPEVLATVFQGGDTLDYADKIIEMVQAKSPHVAAPTEAPPAAADETPA